MDDQPEDHATLRLTDASPASRVGWRRGGEIVVNPDRPFIRNLDDLPMPLHHLLPLDKYRMPMIKGPYTFIVTSRGCTAGLQVLHQARQLPVLACACARRRSIMEELRVLTDLGVHHVHMYADLFTVNREQVVEPVQADHRDGPEGDAGPATAASTTSTKRCCS